jgi:hypothetical protein
MLSEGRAGRLAFTAEGTRNDGTRDWLARRAWRRLQRAADDGDQAAIGAVWQSWLRSPSDELWAALSQWRETGHLTEAVFAAVAEPARWPASRAVLGAFCARHGMAPADPVDRVLFYVLTGQPAQRQAADPDGSLLVTAYQAAPDPIRAELRRELADAGDIDLLRVVASQRGSALSVDESGYLQDQLARRRDWAGLWSLTRGLSLMEAARATLLFGDAWRPADDSGRGLFEQLAAATPETIAAGRAELAQAHCILIRADGLVRGGEFSPDGRKVALRLSGGPGPDVVLVCGLPGGEVAERYELASPYVGLAYTDEALIIADSPALTGSGPFRLRRCVDGRAWDLATDPGWRVAALAPRFAGPGSVSGFAMLAGSQLLLCDGTGEVTSSVPLAMYPRFTDQPWPLLASEPGGKLAVATGSFLMVLADLGSGALPLAHGRPPPFATGLCFAGPGLVASSSMHGLRLQPLEAGMTVQERLQSVEPGMTLPELPYGHDIPVGGARHPVPVVLRNEIAVLGRDDRVHYVSAQARAKRGPRELSRRAGSCLFGTPDGRYHALGGAGFAAVAWPDARKLAALADAPAAQWQPADLATTRRATAMAADYCPGAVPLLRLMLASLEDRFGAELAISRPGQMAGGDDIAISRGPSGGE